MVPNNGFNITPSDTVTFTPALSGVYVGGDGDVVVEYQNGGIATFAAVGGQYVIGKFKRVMATTTATKLVGVVA